MAVSHCPIVIPRLGKLQPVNNLHRWCHTSLVWNPSRGHLEPLGKVLLYPLPAILHLLLNGAAPMEQIRVSPSSALERRGQSFSTPAAADCTTYHVCRYARTSHLVKMTTGQPTSLAIRHVT